MTTIDLNQPKIQVLTTEYFPFTVEWADLVGNGNNVSLPSAVLYDNSNGTLISNGFDNNFGANGTQAQYIVLGTNLLPKHTYTAILTVTSMGQIFKGRLKVEVPR